MRSLGAIVIAVVYVLLGMGLVIFACDFAGQNQDLAGGLIAVVLGFAGLLSFFYGLTFALVERSRSTHWSHREQAARTVRQEKPQVHDQRGLSALERQQFDYEGGEHYMRPKAGDPSAPPLDEIWK